MNWEQWFRIFGPCKTFLMALSCHVEYEVTFGKTDLTELSFQAHLYA
jgi:hypothetical protein